jgi:nucleoside-diphosphate-sugar epimerase
VTPALGLGRRVMTGATGFVGSHFLLRWLRQGEHVVALARADSQGAATERVARALHGAASSLAAPPSFPRAQAMAADLEDAECGLSPSALRSLRSHGASELWHFAASLQYEDRQRAAIFQTNVEGTRRALSLARTLGCRWFVHVSTAYTAGRQRGTIPESLPARDVQFNNCYEESKAEAEHLVAEQCAAHGMRYAILRPSIVVGPYCSKSTGGSSTGLYGFAREILRARGPLGALARPLQIRGEPSTPLNLLPVDWFVEDVAELLREKVQGDGVYHHTLDRSPTIQQVGEVLAELLALPGFSIATSHSADSPLEQLLARRTAFYATYLCEGKSFQRRRAFERQLSLDDVREYLAGCVSQSEKLSLGVPAMAARRHG